MTLSAALSSDSRIQSDSVNVELAPFHLANASKYRFSLASSTRTRNGLDFTGRANASLRFIVSV